LLITTFSDIEKNIYLQTKTIWCTHFDWRRAQIQFNFHRLVPDGNGKVVVLVRLTAGVEKRRVVKMRLEQNILISLAVQQKKLRIAP
jgi:hypothetical protein